MLSIRPHPRCESLCLVGFGYRKPLGACAPRGFLYVWCGGVLLSHTLSGAVPSPCQALASGFGMGPGVSPGPWPPQIFSCTVRRWGLPALWRPGNRIGDAMPLMFRLVARQCSLPSGVVCRRMMRSPNRSGNECCLSSVSTGRLHPSRGFHVRPIDHVFCMGTTAARGCTECLSWSRLPA